MKIGIFGGTFNPIHYGHLRAVEEVQEMLALDKVLFIPSGKPPFKKTGLISARHRYEMTAIAIKNNPLFEISDIEIRTSAISYSVETLNKLIKKYKNAEFFFILGIDAFLDLPKWKQPRRLMALTNLVIISRPGFSFADLLSATYLENVHKKTLKEVESGARTGFSYELGSGKKVFLCKIAGLDISASRIRSLVRAGRTIKYLLPDSVESYIISHKLYRNSQ
jgi:nicotinate-nucleotide adenylyltransferase